MLRSRLSLQDREPRVLLKIKRYSLGGIYRWCLTHRKKLRALVVELVDTRDLKSLGVRAVPVQVRLGAPSIWLLSN